MDGHRFDRLSRILARPATRRGAVAGALALIVAGPTVAPAASRTAICRNLGNACTRNSQCCSGACNTTSASRRTRNRCAVACLALDDIGCKAPGASCCAGLVCTGPASGICRPPS